ncbi:MAG: hypothetical protein ABW049_05390 [Spongiibacteraceae bacterium]
MKAVPTRADGLSAAERRALELACKPGNLLLGRDDGLSAADAACEKLARWRLEANRKSTRR